MTENTTDRKKEINIRQAEDLLFKEWALTRRPFVADGCADEQLFLESHQKIVFVLKERNWGYTVEEQRKFQNSEEIEINDDREIFNGWWTLMAQWADALLPEHNLSESWHQIQDSFSLPSTIKNEDRDQWIRTRNKKSLGKCACVQLKKAPGGGMLNKEDFHQIVSEDKDYILRQFIIYSPHFIISCGSNDNWLAFTRILFQPLNIEQTKNGINYFIASLAGNNHKTAVVNFGHPSMRINGTLWGVLAFGLREALAEIYPKLTNNLTSL